MRRMNFDVKCVRDYLLSHNEVYTVRGYVIGNLYPRLRRKRI